MEKENSKTIKEVIEETEEIKEDIKEESKTKKEDKKINELNIQIESLTNQVKELEDKNMRISAEMINTLRRKEEETNRLLKYASEDIIKELLVVCDNFERALILDGNNENSEVSNFLQGMQMIYNNIVKILNNNEVKEIEALGKEFDAEFHQAVMTDHVEGKGVNEVIEVMQKGYTYKDKVIRPAMVKVNQ